MKKNILLISIMALIIVQPGCDDPSTVTIEELLGKWYFVDGYSTTSFISNTDQNTINSSVPGNGEITVTGQITASLQYVEYIDMDSIMAYSFRTQASFDSTYPYGEFMILQAQIFDQQIFIYYYYHYQTSEDTIQFLHTDSINYLETGEWGDTVKVNPVTLYSYGIDFSSGVPIIVIDSVDISGEISPNFLNITANTPFDFNYSQNVFDDISYFSLEFDESGLLYGLMEMNTSDGIIFDTLDILYDLNNDTLSVNGEWLLGQNVFTDIDSLDIILTEDAENMTLSYQYDACLSIGDTLCYEIFETLIGLEENTLLEILVRDSLVFSKIQPL